MILQPHVICLSLPGSSPERKRVINSGLKSFPGITISPLRYPARLAGEGTQSALSSAKKRPATSRLRYDSKQDPGIRWKRTLRPLRSTIPMVLATKENPSLVPGADAGGTEAHPTRVSLSRFPATFDRSL